MERFRQGLGTSRDRHHVHVVRPQTITPYRHLPQQVQINHPSRIVGQNELPAIPPLRYVVSQIGYNHPSDSRHGPPQYQKTS
jgi:hypothetical protein